MRRGRKIAKVAMARRLAVRLYWMWRKGWNYEQLKKFGSHAGQPGNRHGVQSITRVIDTEDDEGDGGDVDVA
jgi:transposase